MLDSCLVRSQVKSEDMDPTFQSDDISLFIVRKRPVSSSSEESTAESKAESKVS